MGKRLSSSQAVAGKHVHFVGIGGCGMSGLARMIQQAGGICTGSDRSTSSTVESLQADGIEVTLEQTADAVPQDCEILVASAAIKSDHPEILEARRRGVEVVKYAAMLGRMMIDRCGIAVAGTHGKSSTTSMLSHILIDAGLDPSFIVGANCQQIGGGSRSGESDILVAEACEFDRSFHNLHPTHAVILNVEADHMEVFHTLDALVEAFAVFARKLPKDGLLLINHDMSHRLAISSGLDCQVQTLGFSPQADWQVHVQHHKDAPPTVNLMHKNESVCTWTAPLPGEHMAYNAAAAAVLAHRAGADWDAIGKAIGEFAGLDRRMQLMGQRTLNGETITIIDDYGHHPTEVDTTLRALRQHYRPKRLICVFQPHQHSRTRFLMEQFAASFEAADITIVPEIYFVRDSEQERQAVSSQDLVDRLRSRGREAMYLRPFSVIVEHLQVIARDGDLIVTMGAGDVWKVAVELLDESAAA
jgi:UDP-N-acetylmuramate--alanine ligase